MTRRDFLVEIGTEELPPLALGELADAFLGGIVQGLAQAKVAHGRAARFATPRRLAVLVKGVAEQQPEQEISRRGPPLRAAFDPAGLPTRAALAFAESCGTEVGALQRVQEAKGEFLFYSGRKPGALTRDLLLGLVQASLDALPIPKRMRWGSGEAEFVRPVHWIVLLFGKEVLPGTILGVETGALTRGHRFHAPKPIRVTSPASYLGTLRKRGYVLADFDERRERIRAGVLAAATQVGGQAVMSNELLDEVTALVEWPVALTGQFERRFLELPPEVLVATLQDHQRYFPIREPSSDSATPALRAQFVAVANIESRDPSQVRAGNERVVKPRLSDAAFFFNADRQQRLDALAQGLARVTFQAKLGSIADKVQRVRTLAAELAGLTGGDRALADRAALLSKADLLSAMVGEFPELQGTMGRYYALHDGEAPEVAAAIEQHYWPRFAGDALPDNGVARAVAIADRIDTIVSIFAINEKPTGTRDPFGLRRAALGVLRILVEQRLEVDLKALIARAAGLLGGLALQALPSANSAQPGSTVDLSSNEPNRNDLIDSVYDYIMERLRAFYLDQKPADPKAGDRKAGGLLTGEPNAEGLTTGVARATVMGITTEMFDAVLSNRPASPLDFDARLRALASFMAVPDAASLAAANKRIANILRKNESETGTGVKVELLGSEAERALHDALRQLRPIVEPLLERREYAEALQRLATLRPVVDAFFDGVMVMDPDAALRANRLAMLAELRALFLRVADLSRLPG